MLGDKRILITGAASGMGREIAIEAARQGAKNVGITDVDVDGLGVTKELVAANGADVSVLRADLRSSDEIRAMVSDFAAYAGGLDVLVNNAGVLDHVFTPGAVCKTSSWTTDRVLPLAGCAITDLR
jgi:NAD(P)-dependent dehydrogenase (short-subunit alcohol dehydrogenase family)